MWLFKIDKWTDEVLLTTLKPQMTLLFSTGTKLNSKSFSYLCYKSVLVIRELNMLDIFLLAVSDTNLIAGVLEILIFQKTDAISIHSVFQMETIQHRELLLYNSTSCVISN